MLPPKRTIKNKPSRYSNGEDGRPATSLAKPDAARPLMCSKSVPDIGTGQTANQLTNGFDQTFLKHFHRASRLTLDNPTAVARLIRSRISSHQEELWIIALSAGKRITGIEMMFRGTVDSCMVHPRDIIRFICESNATSYIAAHNHPSGELEPSEHDWAFTRRLVACGHLIEIPLIDHVIVTRKGHTSMAAVQPAVFQGSDFNERHLDLPSRAAEHC